MICMFECGCTDATETIWKLEENFQVGTLSWVSLMGFGDHIQVPGLCSKCLYAMNCLMFYFKGELYFILSASKVTGFLMLFSYIIFAGPPLLNLICLSLLLVCKLPPPAFLFHLYIRCVVLHCSGLFFCLYLNASFYNPGSGRSETSRSIPAFVV